MSTNHITLQALGYYEDLTMSDYHNVALPPAVYNAIKEAKPPGMSFYGFIMHEMELDVDPADL